MDDISKIVGETEYCHQEDSFIWDENSQLYYHARSGFYHDPNAGWYYNSRDGFYYKFEDGNYVLFDSYNNKDYQSVNEGSGVEESRRQAVDEQGYIEYVEGNGEGCIDCTSNELPDNPPPSEWLEDTLIELYLSGYPNTASNAADNPLMPEDSVNEDGSLLTTNDAELSLDHQAATDSTPSDFYEEVSWEEESWQAQYGQVVQQEDEPETVFKAVDMWDWSIVREIQKEGSHPAHPVVRLVGRLVQPSSKLHPSMPTHGRRLRTSPISKVHLDLVQVRSGQVYKLRTPSAKYLVTLPGYDASNPTKDWGFPELSIERLNEICESKTGSQVLSQQYISLSLDESCVYEKQKNHAYRDRAAERRELHGGFGEAPGQKRSIDDTSPQTEEAAAEALEMSLGTGSYAQKILKNMGWKEGEGLGKSQQGMKEPLKGIANMGTAGLGWKSR